MTADVPEDDLLHRACAGDAAALAELFGRYRERLRRMIRVRLDPRLGRRVDPSDVLQEAYLDASRRLGEFAARPAVPFYVWLRALTGQRLVDTHRRHLGAQQRDAGREVPLGAAGPAASSQSLAEQVLARLTSPTAAAVRAEVCDRLRAALDALDPLDREVLVLRHFEELNNNETALVLGLDKSAASKRYIRAVRRLKAAAQDLQGFLA
jgi:RNA polymerase sigma-70 factor (ECF subfamily)